MEGYLRGYGFVQYDIESKGYGFDVGYSVVDVKGQYLGGEEPTPLNFAGVGTSSRAGVFFLHLGYGRDMQAMPTTVLALLLYGKALHMEFLPDILL